LLSKKTKQKTATLVEFLV